jgi:glycosyltransferase involved in cell wall biosynthesis
MTLGPTPRILLVGPHPGDQLESIDRYVQLLSTELQTHAEVEVLAPEERFSRVAAGPSARKWLRYVEKYVFFPRLIERRIFGRGTLVHICDQGAAGLTSLLSDKPHLVTCFDLMAIRSAAGEFAEHRTRWTGQRLQSRILEGLNRAGRVACISDATRGDLLKRTRLSEAQVHVVPLCLSPVFKRMEFVAAWRVVSRRVPSTPFVLHVGGNQWYKNRAGVLRIFQQVVETCSSPLNLVLVGKAPTAAIRALMECQSLKGRVYCVSDCGDGELRAFYSAARMLLFPSHHEGFGWPILEAQACGCPVVTTGKEPMTEVGGASAIYIDPADIGGSTRAVCNLLLEGSIENEKRVAAGLLNTDRFRCSEMLERYLELYSEIGAKWNSGRGVPVGINQG